MSKAAKLTFVASLVLNLLLLGVMLGQVPRGVDSGAGAPAADGRGAQKGARTDAVALSR